MSRIPPWLVWTAFFLAAGFSAWASRDDWVGRAMAFLIVTVPIVLWVRHQREKSGASPDQD